MTARLWGLIAGLAVLLGIVGMAYVSGRGDGRKVQREEDAALIERKNAALRAAAAALGNAALRFREIDAATEASLAEARSRAKLAEDLNAQAKREREGLARTVANLNAQRERERTTCTIAEAPICGSPLQ